MQRRFQGWANQRAAGEAGVPSCYSVVAGRARKRGRESGIVQAETKRDRVRKAATTTGVGYKNESRPHAYPTLYGVNTLSMVAAETVSKISQKRRSAAVHSSATATFSRVAISVAWTLSVLVEEDKQSKYGEWCLMLHCLEMHGHQAACPESGIQVV